MLLVLCSKYCYFKNFIFEMFDLKRKITIILITFKRSCFSIFFCFNITLYYFTIDIRFLGSLLYVLTLIEFVACNFAFRYYYLV